MDNQVDMLQPSLLFSIMQCIWEVGLITKPDHQGGGGGGAY